MNQDTCTFCGGTPAHTYTGASIIEDACRRWWNVRRPDGTLIPTIPWDEFVFVGTPTAVADYRRRMAAALGIPNE